MAAPGSAAEPSPDAGGVGVLIVVLVSGARAHPSGRDAVRGPPATLRGARMHRHPADRAIRVIAHGTVRTGPARGPPEPWRARVIPPCVPAPQHPARATRRRRAGDRARHGGPAERRARARPVRAALRGRHGGGRGPSPGRRVLERHGRAPPGRPGSRDRRRGRGHHDALQLRRLGELPAVRACRPALRRHRGGQPRARSGPAGRRPRRPGRAPCCRCTSSAGPAASRRSWRPRGTAAGRSSRTPARASARRSTGDRSAASATSPSSPSTRTSRSRRARAAWSSPTTRRSPRRCAASATRGATPTGPGSGTCASATTTASTSCRPPSGWRSWSDSPSCGPVARGSSRAYAEALGG